MPRFSDSLKKMNTVALLGAFSMFLSTVEYLFPRPIPFMRLGLANLPLLLGLEVFTGPTYILLVFIKVVGQALVNGTLASYVFLFSLSGSVGSALIMFLCHRLLGKRISFLGISLMGAMASNVVQIFLSITFIFGSAAWRILPLFLGIGLVSGLFIGIFAQHFSDNSSWWQAFRADALGQPYSLPVAENKGATADEVSAPSTNKRRHRKKRDRLAVFLHPALRFWTGLILIPAYFFIELPLLKLALVIVFAFLAGQAGKRIRFGYYIILISSITFFHLLTPMGKIIAVIGPLKITSGSLGTGLMKGLTLCGLIFISLFSVSGQLRLPGRIGGLLARTFYYFEEILEGKKGISARDFFGSLDRVLIVMFPPGTYGDLSGTEQPDITIKGGPVPGVLYFLMLTSAVWGALFIQIFLE